MRIADGSRVRLGTVVMYKYVPAGYTYNPAESWWSKNRFSNGSFRTLYLAASARGALAEFLRRHPELLDFQDELIIEMYEIEAVVNGECLDVRTPLKCEIIGAAFSDLTSSDADEVERYRVCRCVGQESRDRGFTGILYPSAALSGTYNLALFDEPSAKGWSCARCDEVELPPPLDPSAVHVLA